MSLIMMSSLHHQDVQRMNKRLKNYPDPVEVVNKYGVDALRWVGCCILYI